MPFEQSPQPIRHGIFVIRVLLLFFSASTEPLERQTKV